jgi:pyridoxine 5'-phosphate synthase PdxJ
MWGRSPPSRNRELNIGHFLIGEAIFSGLEAVIRGCAR